MGSAEGSQERDINQAAYRRLKPTIDQTYPPGRFIAIFDGAVVADAASFEDLETLLRTKGLDNPRVLVFQAGVNYPDRAVIFM